MKKSDLISEIRAKESFLCVGLDTDIAKIPQHLLSSDDPIFEFNKQIIDATHPYCVSYKMNLAFYESLGIQGWKSLIKTVEYIPNNLFVIADAKRGDIGNTSNMYAKAFFNQMNFDAITLAPYMGKDSIEPFLQYEGKWSILLGLTSNKGSSDFQMNKLKNDSYVWEEVIRKSSTWGSEENMMYVIGATQKDEMKKVRELVPNHFLLVPGFGAQGGGLEDIKDLINQEIGVLLNSSRGIIYLSDKENFADKSGEMAKSIRDQMSKILP